MRRFVAFVVLFACSVPVGLSISGCGHNPNNYCIKNGHAYGVLTSQVVYVTLQPETTGLSLAWGQTANLATPAAFNCNHDSESVSHWAYGSTNLIGSRTCSSLRDTVRSTASPIACPMVSFTRLKLFRSR